MRRVEPRDMARGRWHEILPYFGIPAASLTGKHGPCPICEEGRDRFRFDNLNGEGTWICSVCGSGDGFHLAMRKSGKDFRAVLGEVERLVVGIEPQPAPKPMSDGAKRDALRALWKASTPTLVGDVADAYLQSRMVGLHIYPESLRTLKACRTEGTDCAALLAVVSDVDGKPITLHRTYLATDGSGKAAVEAPRKLMPGEVPKGAAVRLDPPTLDGALGIAEGLETALAASLMFDMPVWSAINATMMAAWEPPEGVSEVVIFMDNDPKFAGFAAGYTLAHRLACRKGMTVQVKAPDQPGTDWCDVWAETRRRMA